MPNNITNIVRFNGDRVKISELLKSIQNDEHGYGSVDFNKIIPMPDTVFRGNLGPNERALYGNNNWYDWSVANWHTKWNAYGFEDLEEHEVDDELRFETAWAAPHPILQKLSEMAPDLKITHRWADEDFGMNCGERGYKSGEITGEFLPEGGSVEAYNLAAEVMECEVSDYGLRLNSDGSAYINIANDEYELIEIFGKPALFTNERMHLSDIPQGLYKCDVRGDDETTGGFAELAPCVQVNHFGTIITDEPIDFGKEGYIVLNDKTEPNFMGNSLTMEQYMQGDFKHVQNEDGGMNLE